MRRASAAVLALLLAASARAQMRVEAVAPVVSPAGAGVVPRGLAPAVLAPSALTTLSAPSLNAPLHALPVSARAPHAFAAPSVLAPRPFAAAAVSASPSAEPERTEAAEPSAAGEPVSLPVAPGRPSASNFGRWSLPKSAEGSAWRFRDLPFLGSSLWDGSRRLEKLGAGAMGAVFVHPSRPGSVVKVARLSRAGLFGPRERALGTLDGALHRTGPLLGESETALPWPKSRRYAALAALLGALAFAPALARAALPAAPSALGLLPSWSALAGLSLFLALAGIPLRLFAHRLAPWIMKRSKDQGGALARERPSTAVPALAIAAAVEEALFRGLAFLGGAVLLLHVLPPLAAFATAALASSLVFALVHGYGSVWTRVVGGLIYAGALLATGSLVLPVATHFAYNLALYVHGRRLRR